MTSTRPFDYDEFVHDFRDACAQYGIDPALGATEYQVVHVIAETRRRAYQPGGWWMQHDLWLNSAPYRSDTEQEAIWNVFLQAYGKMARRVAQAIRLQRAQMALWELRQRQTGNGGISEETGAV